MSNGVSTDAHRRCVPGSSLPPYFCRDESPRWHPLKTIKVNIIGHYTMSNRVQLATNNLIISSLSVFFKMVTVSIRLLFVLCLHGIKQAYCFIGDISGRNTTATTSRKRNKETTGREKSENSSMVPSERLRCCEALCWCVFSMSVWTNKDLCLDNTLRRAGAVVAILSSWPIPLSPDAPSSLLL